MNLNPPTVFSGLLWDKNLVQVDGLRICSPTDRPDLALSSFDGRARTDKESVQLLVAHNTIGEWPLEVREGYGPDSDNIDVRNALSWRNDDHREHPRYAGTQLIVAPGGRVLSLADSKLRVGYGAGHPRANGYGVNLEMAAHSRDNGGGTVLYKGQIHTAAAVFNKLAELAGMPKVAQSPRTRGRELVKALADPRSKASCLADHCAFTRQRGLGDTGYLVAICLHDEFGWTLKDFDAKDAAVVPTDVAGPVSWLLAEDEIHDQEQTETWGQELSGLVETVLHANLGLSTLHAFHVAAHAACESGRALKDVGYNWWGWKARKEWADSERAKGRKALWWRRRGHAGAGDPAICYYRGFSSPVESVLAFLMHFCPRPGTSSGIYKKAGEAFWDKNPAGWFKELLLAGYRGTFTAENPDESIRDHERLVQEMREVWAQRVLKITIDGSWGKGSKAALGAKVGSEYPTQDACDALAKSS